VVVVVISFRLGGQKAAVSDSAEGWCAAGNLIGALQN